ncbi:MAG: hypothetical protein FWF88_06930 [Peptococcaceae bacterium]|nr:hypothetical protein [Peptococcaceae bacterium]
MSIIFNELIASDAFFPFREGEEKDGPRILCLNEYQFIPVPVGGCDILLNTRIVKDENKAASATRVRIRTKFWLKGSPDSFSTGNVLFLMVCITIIDTKHSASVMADKGYAR